MKLRWVEFEKGRNNSYHGKIGRVTVWLIYKEGWDAEKPYVLDKPYWEDDPIFQGTLEECKAEALRLLNT